MHPALLIRPHYLPKPWGGRALADVLGRSDLPPGRIGESWEVADTDAVASVVVGGPHDGQRLRDVLGYPFPLLLKVLDAHRDLSVQVHPDGRDGTPAKEEAWVALESRGEVAVGGDFRGPDLPTSGQWLARMQRIALQGPAGTRAPSLVHVPGGTVHAILAGALVFEVQNPVDVTWRLDDQGRPGLDGQPRKLHLDFARAVLRRAPPAPAPLAADGTRLEGGRFRVELLAPGDAAVAEAAASGPRAAFLLGGGEITWPGGRLTVPRARTAVLPPSGCVLSTAGWTVLATATG